MEVPLGTILIDPEHGVTGIVRVQRSVLTKLGRVRHIVGVCTSDFHGGMRVKRWYPVERVTVVGAHGVVMQEASADLLRWRKALARYESDDVARAEHAFDGLPGRLGSAA